MNKRGFIDWDNTDILNHNIFNEVNIYITNLSNEVNFTEYHLNFKTFLKHFKNCLLNTYQTFGQRINKNINLYIIDNLMISI